MSQWYSGANLKLAATEADAPMSFSGTLQHMFFSGSTTTGAWIEGVAVGTDDNVVLNSVNSIEWTYVVVLLDGHTQTTTPTL